jgi:hypothetical protein
MAAAAGEAGAAGGAAKMFSFEKKTQKTFAGL